MTTSTPLTPNPTRENNVNQDHPISSRPIAEKKISHTGFDGNSSVIHMAPNVREDFSLQPEVADSLAVLARLFRRSG